MTSIPQDDATADEHEWRKQHMPAARVVERHIEKRGVVLREPTKLLIILVPDAAAAAPAVEEIIARYRQRFAQDSVLHAEQPVCVAF